MAMMHCPKWLSFTKTKQLWMSNPQLQRPYCETLHRDLSAKILVWHCFSRTPAGYWWQVIHFGLPSFQKGQCLFQIGICFLSMELQPTWLFRGLDTVKVTNRDAHSEQHWPRGLLHSQVSVGVLMGSTSKNCLAYPSIETNRLKSIGLIKAQHSLILRASGNCTNFVDFSEELKITH